ncbi:MAG: hydroxyethylthiazole kinase, partial [Alphaproteobacteria bacterium]
GTIDKNFIRLTHKAVLLAKQYGKPIVFDPVGSGTTTIRTNAARDIMSSAQIIRGNASEIISLKSYIQSTKGVESSDTTDDAKNPAYLIASQYNATVIVSGKIDFITNGQRSVDVEFGSQTMQLITGMGCALTAVCAAFHSVISDAFDASALSTYYFTLCGEIVSQSHHMPGTFKSAFLDQIHHPNFKTMRGIYAL